MSYTAKNIRRITKNIEIYGFQGGKKNTKHTQTHIKATTKAKHSPKK